MKRSGSELDPGQQILAFMRPQVEADKDFYLRWQEVEQANPDKDAYLAAGLPIEEVYSGVDALREDEVLALQAMAVQNEIIPASDHDGRVRSMNLLQALKGGLVKTREKRWKAVHGEAFKGLLIDVERPQSYEADRRRSEPRGLFGVDFANYTVMGGGYLSSEGNLDTDIVIRGRIKELSITQGGAMHLGPGHCSYEGEYSGERPFSDAIITNLFADMRNNRKLLRFMPTVEIKPITDPDPALSIAVELREAA
jgi:hypothetical protein